MKTRFVLAGVVVMMIATGAMSQSNWEHNSLDYGGPPAYPNSIGGEGSPSNAYDYPALQYRQSNSITPNSPYIERDTWGSRIPSRDSTRVIVTDRFNRSQVYEVPPGNAVVLQYDRFGRPTVQTAPVIGGSGNPAYDAARARAQAHHHRSR